MTHFTRSSVSEELVFWAMGISLRSFQGSEPHYPKDDVSKLKTCNYFLIYARCCLWRKLYALHDPSSAMPDTYWNRTVLLFKFKFKWIHCILYTTIHFQYIEKWELCAVPTFNTAFLGENSDDLPEELKVPCSNFGFKWCCLKALLSGSKQSFK